MTRRRWILLALVFIAIMINYVDRGNLSIAAPAMMKDFRITPESMGVLLSAFFWTYAIFQIPAGMLVDRFGIRWSYTLAFLVWSLASAAIALASGPGDVIGLRMVLGLAESIAPLASISFIRSNYSGKEQGFPTAVYIAGQNLGPAIGVLLGAILLDQFGWRTMFAITGLGALIWVPCWLFAAPPDGTRAERQAARAAEEPAGPRPWTWRMVLSNGTFWAMTLSILLSSYYWYFVLTWVPSYLVLSRGFSTLGMGRILSSALFAMAVMNVIAGAAADRVAARVGVFRARLWFGVLGYLGTGVILLLLVTDRSWSLPVLAFSLCATGSSTRFQLRRAPRPPLSPAGSSAHRRISDRRLLLPVCVPFWPASACLPQAPKAFRESSQCCRERRTRKASLLALRENCLSLSFPLKEN